MTFQEFRTKLKDFLIFSVEDISKIDTTFRRALLNDWQTKNYIKKIRRGYYVFSDTSLQEESLFIIANRLYQPSYISLEMALSRYNLIPESVYSLTSVTTKKTISFDTIIGTFMYRNIKPTLYFGYTLQTIDKKRYIIADVEKAVLDIIYLNKKLSKYEDFEAMRINKEEFLRQANMEKFNEYTKTYKNKAFKKRVEAFLSYIKS